jgi:hypothetical protein
MKESVEAYYRRHPQFKFNEMGIQASYLALGLNGPAFEWAKTPIYLIWQGKSEAEALMSLPQTDV